jgi:hypothetical protein
MSKRDGREVVYEMVPKFKCVRIRVSVGVRVRCWVRVKIKISIVTSAWLVVDSFTF